MDNKESLKQKLFEKIEQEYEKYIDNLVNYDSKTVINMAYEIVSKEEMMYKIKDRKYETNELKALLKCSNVLQECYEEWLKTDANFNEVLGYAVDRRIDIITNDYIKEKAKRNKESR